MALNDLFGNFYTDINDNGIPRIIRNFWDDVALDFVVHSWINTAAQGAGDVPEVHDHGRTALSTDVPTMNFLLLNFPSSYQRCIGNTLRSFRGQPEYPYAYKIDTANSPVCNVIICDLNILQPTLTTPSNTTLSADGTAVIRVTTSYGPVQFSLVSDSGPWEAADNVVQISSIKLYSDLTAGIYTVYVKDVQGCTGQANFEITSLGDYELKYFSETVQNNKELRIEI